MTINKENLEELSTRQLYDTMGTCADIIIGRRTQEKAAMEPEKAHNVYYGAVVNEISTLNSIKEQITFFSN